MNKTELVAAVADQAEISKKDAEKALAAFTAVVTDELKKGGMNRYIYIGKGILLSVLRSYDRFYSI